MTDAVTSFQSLAERAVRGDEFSLEEIAAGLRAFRAVRKLDLPTTSILLARAAAGMNKAAWFSWASEMSGLTKAEVYHRAKIGRLLLDIRDKKVLYRKLLAFPGDKLLALSRLPVEAVEGFLAVTDAAGLTVKQLRYDVECEIRRLKGLPAPARQECEQPDLFGESLDTIFSMESDDERFLFKDDDTADKAASSGISLVNAYLAFQYRKPDGGNRVDLLQLKADLQSQIRAIEDLLDQKENNDDPSQIQTDECGTTPAAPALSASSDRSDKSDKSDVRPDECGTTPSGPACADRRNGGVGDPDAAGEGAGGGAGTPQIPDVHPRPQAAAAAPFGSADRGSGGDRTGGGIPDPAGLRPAGPEPADLQQLPQLAPTGGGVPPESGGGGADGLDR